MLDRFRDIINNRGIEGVELAQCNALHMEALPES